MKNRQDCTELPDGFRVRRLVVVVCLAGLAAAGGCATSGAPPGVSPAKETKATKETTASQIYGLFYTLKTNAMAAAADNALPSEHVSDQCKTFLNSLNEISPGLEFRLVFEPFVTDLFLVDADRTGGCYGCKTNTVYQQNAGRLVADGYGQGVGWVLPVGPKGEKAILILSNIGPLRTTIILFDDPLHGQLVYDSYGTSGGGGVYYLCGVEVEDQNHFLLHEGVWPPSQGQELVVPRTLRLTVNDRMEVELGE